jgi:hypothetical protein
MPEVESFGAWKSWVTIEGEVAMSLTRMVWMLLLAILAVSSGVAWAQDGRSDARLQFSSTSFGLLVGYGQGQGVLEFQGKRYPFAISGFKLATVGITRVSALGQVYRLREVADFAGRYVAVEGAATLVQGGGNAVLRNERGVTLYLQNVQQGLELTLGGGSFTIALAEPAEAAAP